MEQPRQRFHFSPPQLLAASVFGLIAVGGILLSLPFASAPGHTVSVLDAFFTSTSAVCVTGLVVRDTPVAFSAFGHLVILLLIQAGGLGYMTFSTVLAAAIGRAVTLQERMTLQEALNVQGYEGLVRFTLTVFRFTVVFELIGAAILWARWVPELGVGRAAWYGLFHSVSAFNNAGFALWSDNLMSWRGDLVVNFVITTLIIFGGLGFFVLTEIFRRPSRAVRISTHTRMVVTVTAILVAGGTVALLALEWYNPRTLAALPPGERVLAAYFQSVSARTAGFNTIDIGALTHPALFVTMALMFIGASPGSTGGGVKTTTFAITVAALWATVRGDQDAVVFGRRLPSETVAKAFFISLIAFLMLNLVAGALLVSEARDLLPTLFEATSAFGTVGLSMGENGAPVALSAFFTPVGKILIAAMMFMGRVGPLTLAFAVARRARARARVRYPEGKVLIG
jgi:trk system potassium uptake protein TrkH